MWLRRDNLVAYLLERGLTSRRALFAEGVAVIEESRRHLGFRVRFRSRPGYFLKHARGPHGSSALAREARVYLDPGFQDRLGSLLADCHGYDAARAVLVLEDLAGESLHRLFQRTHDIPPERAAQAGAALAAVHRVPAPGFPARLPWILTLPTWELDAPHERDPRARELARSLASRADLMRALYGVAAAWRPSALIHGDMKWDNVVAAGDGVRLVDWETADRGDPAWDVGGLLQGCVALPLVAGSGDLSRAAAAVEEGYACGDDRFAGMARRCAGARLLQTAFEYLAAGSAPSVEGLIGAAEERLLG